MVGRYGGEEFIISLPETEEAEAKLVAERLRRSIADSTVTTARGAIRMTVSIGIATSAEDVPAERHHPARRRRALSGQGRRPQPGRGRSQREAGRRQAAAHHHHREPARRVGRRPHDSGGR
ncbi:MAG: diguanylate cyclase [Pseudomonadota bacterium]